MNNSNRTVLSDGCWSRYWNQDIIPGQDIITKILPQILCTWQTGYKSCSLLEAD